jgi:hypothetical protein
MPIQKGPANLGTGSVDSTELSNTLDLSAKTVTYRTIVAGDIASNAITTAKITDANITPAKMANSGAEFGMRNRIINGAMVIDQRNAGASVATSGTSPTYTLDRWQANFSQTSKYTVQQGPLNGTLANFSYALGITSTSAYSLGVTDLFSMVQRVEGYNIADLAWGTANAKTVTLSAWVYSSLTGTFGGSIINSDVSRTYPFSYSIPSANTWTQISITIPGDTTGTWLNTNGVGMRVYFNLGCGTALAASAGTWIAGGYYGASGCVNVVGTNGATWYVTGVQLEKGSTATSFDYRPYGTELQLCQRYFWKIGGTAVYEQIAMGLVDATTQVSCITSFPVAMRSAPSLGYSSSGAFQINDAATQVNATNAAIYQPGLQTTGIVVTASGLTVGRAARFFIGNSTSAYINFSAEL